MARKKQTFLILLGISFGTLLFVSISGLQLGMRQYIMEQLLNNTAHVLISGAENDILVEDITDIFYQDRNVLWTVPPGGKRAEVRLENYQAWVERLQNDPDVLDFSPRLNSNVLLSNGEFSQSVGITGIIPERYERVSKIKKFMREGSFNDLKGGGNRIILGSGVAQRLGTRLDRFISVNAGRGLSQPFKVVGIVHFGNRQIDDSLAFAHLTNVQTLNRSPGRVTAITVALTDIDRAPDVANRWEAQSSDKVEDWQEANKMFMEMIRFQDITRYFITGAILIVAAFGVYNVLTIMINQKRREIAILRAIGYGPQRILELILYQGLILGIGGGLAGLLMGFLLCLWIGSIDMGFEIGGSNNLLISYDPSIYVIAFISANLASLVASYLPAREASLMTPMDIIRSE